MLTCHFGTESVVALCGSYALELVCADVHSYSRTAYEYGGGTTEVAVISLGGIVVSRSVRVGGIRMDAAIINFIKREFNMLIGDRTAEDVKFDLGAALPMNDVRRAFVRGRDLVTNLPQTAEITSTMVYEALKAPCQAISPPPSSMCWSARRPSLQAM